MSQNTAIAEHLPSISPFFLLPKTLYLSHNKATQSTGLCQLSLDPWTLFQRGNWTGHCKKNKKWFTWSDSQIHLYTLPTNGKKDKQIIFSSETCPRYIPLHEKMTYANTLTLGETLAFHFTEERNFSFPFTEVGMNWQWKGYPSNASKNQSLDKTSNVPSNWDNKDISSPIFGYFKFLLRSL